MGVVLKDFQIPVFTQNALLSIQIFNMISWKNLNKGWCLINSFPWWDFALKKIIDLHVTLTFIQIRVDKGLCLWNTELENRLVLHWFFFHGGIKKITIRSPCEFDFDFHTFRYKYKDTYRVLFLTVPPKFQY